MEYDYDLLNFKRISLNIRKLQKNRNRMQKKYLKFIQKKLLKCGFTLSIPDITAKNDP